ncbi:MAG: alpha-amylase family glycosyl hydrolase [Cytophagales bacterium]|nr:alpha-amylase family glycosyl hydrolase [Cytophagales bacterium]
MKKLLSLLLCAFGFYSWGQTVSLEPTLSPENPTADEELTITYDVTGTDLESLDNAWLWLWLPDKDDVDVASNVNPATSNAGATDVAKFTKTEENSVVTFSITLTISEFADASDINEVGVLLKADDWSGGQTSDFIFNAGTTTGGGETSGTHDIKPIVSPDFPAADEPVTVTYITGGTDLEGIGEAWLWTWAPDLSNAGVNSNINPASSDPTATDPAKFTREVIDGQEAFTITFTPTDLIQASASELNRVGILMKGDDWSNGQTTDSFIEISDGFAMKVNSPETTRTFYNPGDQVEVDVATSEAATITVSLDGTTVSSVSGSTALQYTHQVITDGAAHSLVIEATNGTDTETFTHSYSTTPTTPEVALPAGLVDGANYTEDDTQAYLVLTAPGKDNVFVLGSFNNWSLDQDFLMNKDGDKFWLEITGLTSGQEYLYQYLIDGEIVIADPYTEKVISSYDDGQIRDENRYPGLVAFPSAFTTGETAVLQTNRPEFDWEVTDFQKPAAEDLVIYELLVRDFTEERTYNAVTERLDYLDSLGVNAIELMPITEYEGNISWGYNPSYKFAVDKFYGTEDELKTLIDEAHKRGMAIIIDMVLNHHFGRSPLVQMEASGAFGPPTADNAWFNVTPKHDFNVGFDFDHESQFTQDYVDRVVTYWIEEYKVDGYRFDLSKGFTQKNSLGNVGLWGEYDITRINLLSRMANVIWETDPEAYVMLEHFAVNQEERALADLGMMLWSNTRHSNLDWQYFETRGWQSPHNINYLESHDEERVMWENRNAGSLEERISDAKVDAAFFFMVPGPKMIWQFGEFAYDEELNNDRLGIKPTRWEYLEDAERLQLFGLYQSLINLKTQTDYLSDEHFSWNASSSVRWINYEHPDVQISMFGNPTSSSRDGDPHFVAAGDWYDYFTGEQITITDPNASVTLAPGEFYIYTSEPIDNFTTINVESSVILSTGPQQLELTTYPNPFVEEFTIQGVNTIDQIVITDLSGRLISEFSPVAKTFTVNAAAYETGIYLIEVISGNTKETLKMIKRP